MRPRLIDFRERKAIETDFVWGTFMENIIDEI